MECRNHPGFEAEDRRGIYAGLCHVCKEEKRAARLAARKLAALPDPLDEPVTVLERLGRPDLAGADQGWLETHGELLPLHIEKSATYGNEQDRLANFTAVAAATGNRPEQYVIERIVEKATRCLNMIRAGAADEVREYPDMASLALVCEALRRRRAA